MNLPARAMAKANRPKKKRINHDWTRNPPPGNLTPFQRFVREVDWSLSPLGPMDQWPDQLRQFVLVCIADPQPSVVLWGDSQAIIYNEAYVQVIGSKHPGLQGQDPRVGGLAEVWDQIDALLLEGERTGETFVGESSFLLLHRHGYLEETYFNLKFIPMVGPEGYVVSSYVTVHDNTEEFLESRRRSLVRTTIDSVASANDLPSLWSQYLLGFEESPNDIPFALIYSNYSRNHGSLDRPASTFTLEGNLGLPAGHPLVPERIQLEGTHLFSTAMNTARQTESMNPIVLRLVDGTLPPSAFNGVTEWRGFGAPVTEVAICPMKSESDRITAFAIIGINPRKRYDRNYKHFLSQLTCLIPPRLTLLLLAQERERRAIMTKEAAVQRERLSGLLRTEMRFANFADRAPVGLCVTDIEGSILYANEAWYNFSGIDPMVPDGIGWMDSVVPEDRRVLEDAWYYVTEEKISWTFQCRSKMPWKSGSMENQYKTGLCNAYPDLDEKTGAVTSVMSIIVDISELKWNEEQVRSSTRQLKESELKYRQFAEHAPLGVCRASVEGEVSFANAAWLDIFDFEAGDEKPWLERMHPEDVDKCDAFLKALQSSRKPMSIEHRLVKPWSGINQAGSDDPTWVLASAYPELGATGNVESIICWVTDISAQKAAARAITDRMEEAILLKNRQEVSLDFSIPIRHVQLLFSHSPLST